MIELNEKDELEIIELYASPILTWFENRCKNDMSQEEWNNIKSNIKDYLS